MDTIERFEVKFKQRDRELNKRGKLEQMNRFGEAKQKKTKHKRTNNKHQWLQQDTLYA